MENNDFWNNRLNSYKTRLITSIIDYCDIYDILHDEVFSPEKVKTELYDIVDNAIKSFISDNYN